MADNSANVIDIEDSPSELLALIGFFVFFMVGTGTHLIFGAPPAEPVTSTIEILGVLGLLLCTLICLWQFVFGHGPVITISPQGICDRRHSADIIPWTAVQAVRVSCWSFAGMITLILTIDPAVEQTLRRSAFVKCMRWINRAFGVKGLYISALGLKIGYAELRKLIEARIPAAARA